MDYNKEFIDNIHKLISERAEVFINSSDSFSEAIEKANKHSLYYRHGNIGLAIDKSVNEYITTKALNQSIRSNLTTEEVE